MIGVGGGGGGGGAPTFCTSRIQTMSQPHNTWLHNVLWILCVQNHAPLGHRACMSSPMPFKERHSWQATIPQKIGGFEIASAALLATVAKCMNARCFPKGSQAWLGLGKRHTAMENCTVSGDGSKKLDVPEYVKTAV